MSMDEYVHINVWIEHYDIIRSCWECAKGDLTRAKRLYAWVNNAPTPEDKAVRAVALNGCNGQNPIAFYQWIAPLAETSECPSFFREENNSEAHSKS